MPYLERSWMDSPYHYCNMCWRRFHLSQLTWQRGMLKCPQDLDTSLIGDRELTIMRVLSTGPQDELAPDQKLQSPNPCGLIEDIIL